MFGSHDRCGAVVVFRAIVDNQPALLKISSHWRAWIGSGVLNVRPIDVTSREFKVGLNRLSCISRVADNKTTDDIHLVAAQRGEGFEAGVTGLSAIFTLQVLGGGAQEVQVGLQDILNAEENVAETRSPHQRHESLAVVGDG